MRQLATILLALVYVCLTTGVIGLGALRFSGLSGGEIKTELQRNDVYRRLQVYVITSLDEANKTAENDDPWKLLSPFIKSEITAAYVQTKVETALDDTEAWLQGQTTTVPVISFNDLKEKLLKKNAKLVKQLEQMAEEYQKQKPELERQLKAEAETKGETVQPLPDIDVKQIIHRDWIIPIGTYLGGLKTLVKLVALFPWIIAAVAGCGGLIIWVSGRARVMGWVLIAAILVNGLPLLLLLLLNRVEWTTSVTTNLPVEIKPLIVAVTQPIIRSYVTVAETVLGIYAVLTAVLFLTPNRRAE